MYFSKRTQLRQSQEFPRAKCDSKDISKYEREIKMVLILWQTEQVIDYNNLSGLSSDKGLLSTQLGCCYKKPHCCFSPLFS